MVWSPFGLDPLPRDAVVIAFVGAFGYFWGYSALRVVLCVTAAFLLDLFWWATIIGAARTRLRRTNVKAVQPAVIVYVPGLNASWLSNSIYDWLFGGGTESPRMVIVPPPSKNWFVNLGDDTYVNAVVAAIRALPPHESQRIALVGSSRGAGVVLRVLSSGLLPAEKFMAAVCLNGPFATVGGVMEHRYGWVGRLATPLVERICSPTRLDDVAVPTLLPPLFFVTGAGDTNISPDDVRSAAKRWRGHLIEVSAATPHSLMFGPYEDKRKIQDYIALQLSSQ